jgi:hypothetical protein
MRPSLWMLCLAGFSVVGSAWADIAKDLGVHQAVGRDVDAPEWVEEQATPPAFPKDADLVEFYVSAGTANRFFVDASTLSAGKDGIVRYTLVVKTSGGATNTTYEGIRCKTGEYRLYASGRTDGTWALARIADWRPIENKPVNRHHAALNRDLFCPLATPIDNAEDGRAALRRGKHPRAP